MISVQLGCEDCSSSRSNRQLVYCTRCLIWHQVSAAATTQLLVGTYLGLVEKLDYLQALGINAVELLPVQEFNELEYYQVPLDASLLASDII